MAAVVSEGGCVRGVLKCLNALWNWPLVYKVYVLSIFVMSWFFSRFMLWFDSWGSSATKGIVVYSDGIVGKVFFFCFLCGFLLAVIFGSRISTRMAFLHPVISFGIAACFVFDILSVFTLNFVNYAFLLLLIFGFPLFVVLFVLGRELGEGVNYILVRFLHRGCV